MADPAELKAKVTEYLRRLKAERDKAAATYTGELARMDSQIAATEKVLAAWDTRVDGLIQRLTDAGIQINAG